MNECVQRWRENQPLSTSELLQMRVQAILRVSIFAAVLIIVAIALCGCRTLQAKQVEPGPKFPAFEVPEKDQTFEGVTIVVCVKGLTDYAPELRAKAAREADRVLQQLAERKLPGRVRTRLIAEVAEPYSFRNFEAAAMTSAQPVFVHVLVPAKNRGLSLGLILKKVEELASSHFLEDLQKYKVLVTFERLEPDKYRVGVQAASLQEPTHLPPRPLPHSTDHARPIPPLPSSDKPEQEERQDRGGLIITLLTAWLTERSKFAKKLMGCYQSFKGRVV